MEEETKQIFRNCTYKELIERNIPRPLVMKNIKQNVIETLSILMNGLNYSSLKEYCIETKKKIISRSTFFEYIHIIGPVIEKLSARICGQNFDEAIKQISIKFGFDGCWSHRRQAHQCMGVLIDLITGKIVAYAIAHNGNETSQLVMSTDKNSKCLEGETLKKIIQDTELFKYSNLVFVHDCDLSESKLLSEYLPSARILFDTNHYVKKQKKIIQKSLSKCKDLRNIIEKVQNFYSILVHDEKLDTEQKKEKWNEVPNHYIEKCNWNEEVNGLAINKLKKLVEDLKDSFENIDSALSTNTNESFNHVRSMIANKNIAWRHSWLIRAHLAVIKWNDPYYMCTILKEFDIEPNIETVNYISTRYQQIMKRRTTTKTEQYKKVRSIKRRKKRFEHPIKKSDNLIHFYKDEEKEREIREKK